MDEKILQAANTVLVIFGTLVTIVVNFRRFLIDKKTAEQNAKRAEQDLKAAEHSLLKDDFDRIKAERDELLKQRNELLKRCDNCPEVLRLQSALDEVLTRVSRK
jgi:hypothetical protein